MGFNRYNAKRTYDHGIWFASGAEKDCDLLLQGLEAAGEIQILQRQSRVHLTKAAIIYIADWCIFDKKLNQEVWVEYKGFETDMWRLKRKLWTKYGPGILRVYKKIGKRIKLYEEIFPDSEPTLFQNICSRCKKEIQDE